ncbi:MFS transporter [Pseudomonas sp. xss_2]|uniref:MFS transporter n=1 Tax=Pseudomonas sp. xss_2 TaxID=3367215 RepID=UPI003709F664
MTVQNRIDNVVAPYGISPTVPSRDIKFATMIAFFAWVFAVYDFILFGTLLPEMGAHFGWDAAKQSWIATLVALGGCVVALVIGPIVDRLGRRKGVIITVGGAAVSSLATALGGSLGTGTLVAIRSVAGLGYAEQTINATYLSELYASTDDPKLVKRKGFIYSLVQGGWPVGALLAAGLTALLMPLIGWQGSFIFAAIPSFVIALLAFKLKESPQFLMHAKMNELKAAGQYSEAADIAKHQGWESGDANTGLAGVFRGSSRRAALILGFAHLLCWFPIQVFSVLGTTVIIEVHRVSFENSLMILVMSNLVAYVGYLTHGWLGDRFGRRNVIGIGWILGAVAFTAMLLVPTSFSAIVALYSIGLFFLIGPFAAMLFFVSESFHTPIRASAGAVVSAMGPIGAVLAGIGSTYVLSNGGTWLTCALWFGAFPCLLAGLLMFAAKKVDPSSVR